MHVDEEVEIAAVSSKLSRSILTLTVKGFSHGTEKTIFCGAVDAVVTKDIVRKIKSNQPELLEKVVK